MQIMKVQLFHILLIVKLFSAFCYGFNKKQKVEKSLSGIELKDSTKLDSITF